MALTLRARSTGSATTGSINKDGTEPDAAAPAPAAYVPGPQTYEERLIVAHLNAITADALPGHEWFRFGVVWKPSYHLIPKGAEAPHERWRGAMVPDDVFDKLNRALKIPCLTDAKAIKDSGPGTLTMSFCEAVGEHPEGLRRVCMDSGHPFMLDGHHRFLEELVPVVVDGEYVPDADGGIYCVRTGNLAFLQQEWHRLKAHVDFEFGLTAQMPPALQPFDIPPLARRTAPEPAQG